jgi:adenosylmethionine-8-amino-7-oxononanoate aminotransferase
MHRLAKLDHRYVWHPFTQMRQWLQREPIVIVSGRGAVLRDVHGREYLDANSSIWTNLHGHRHPQIDAALRRQLRKIAHCSALGLANEPASLLAAELVRTAQNAFGPRASATAPALQPTLTKVFFSDDGSTALEVALKLAYEFARRTGRSRQPRFCSLQGAYHGDTVGAVSLGHISLFHRSYAGLCFRSDAVPAPYCYRCPHNRGQPQRSDARSWRRCRWECVDEIERAFDKQAKRGNPYAAFVFEPLIQGAAGMIAQPPGWLQRATEIARSHGALLIADEVLTGFGRCGSGGPLRSDPMEGLHSSRAATRSSSGLGRRRMPLFACGLAGVRPDFLCLAKGMTGGYLPMAATLTTQAVFDAFLGEYHEFKTFFHGHSYTANPLGAAAALASLKLLNQPAGRRARAALEAAMHQELQALWALEHVGDIRQVGLIAGIELVRDWRTRCAFDLAEAAGARVCEAMARRGVLTRPIGNVVVLMPPYCTTRPQLRRMVGALAEAIEEVLGHAVA